LTKENIMKTIQILIALLIGLLSNINLHAQGKLEVTVTNIKEQKGTIRVGLFNSEEKFLKEVVDGKIVKAAGNEVTVLFENLKSGTYALSVIHDQNENGELDMNMIGIPSEGFAFGNNSMGMFGPPSFDDAKVIITDRTVVKQLIKLKYF
jgi:uncharacterized protein (DUF2141 family)